MTTPLKTAHDHWYAIEKADRPPLKNLDGFVSGKTHKQAFHDWYFTKISEDDFYSNLGMCTTWNLQNPDSARRFTPWEPFNGPLRRSSKFAFARTPP